MDCDHISISDTVSEARNSPSSVPTVIRYDYKESHLNNDRLILITTSDEVITLSSDLTHKKVLQSPSERCPVTWETPTHNEVNLGIDFKADNAFTPSPHFKVQNWLDEAPQCVSEPQPIDPRPLSLYHLEVLSQDLDKLQHESKKTILVRQDYPKLAQEEVQKEVPLSPESQKKNELVAYLQLRNMKPQSTDNTVQNRRSHRVRQLAQLTEQKEQERKINEVETVGEDSAKKSLVELGLTDCFEDRIKHYLNTSMCHMKNSNFDDTMREFLKKSRNKKFRNRQYRRFVMATQRREQRRPLKVQSTCGKSLRSIVDLKSTEIKSILHKCIFRKYKKRVRRRKKEPEILQPKPLIETENVNSLTPEHREALVASKMFTTQNYVNPEEILDNIFQKVENEATSTEVEPFRGFTNQEEIIIEINHLHCLDLEGLPRVEDPPINPIVETVEPLVKCTPRNKNVEMKSLHNNLSRPKRKLLKTFENGDYNEQSWSENDKSEKVEKIKTSQSHSINFSSSNGLIVNACYIDYNLIIAQELIVSLWSQSALGNILGAQHMWIPKGNVHRLVLENECFLKESPETVISIENTCAYVELWTKEHTSDKRERPVADVFVVVYFWKLRPVDPIKKVLQLENISGYAKDVQYVVTRFSRNIIVSWNIVSDNNKTTLIHCYQLAADYQTVASIKEIQSVSHYVSSLHTIEDCEGLIMGCGDHKLTLWNLEYGYIVTTIDFHEVGPQPNSLWATCDRGFLFTIQHFQDGSLQLIAINGINFTWKKLQSYNSPNGYHNLQGACIDNGLLVAFYDNGVLCWNVQTSEIIFEEASTETVYMPSGKHVIMMSNDQINVKHAVGYLVTSDET